MESIYLILNDSEYGIRRYCPLAYIKTLEEAFIIKAMLKNRYTESTFKIIEIGQIIDDGKCIDELLHKPLNEVTEYANNNYHIHIIDDENIKISKKNN